MPSSRTAVIAGVGPGLGAALARRFGKEGCRLGLLARSAAFIGELAAELGKGGVTAQAAACDLAESEQVSGAFKRVRDQLGPVDILINHASAGGPMGRGLLETSLADFERAWRVSALGALQCCREAVPDMLQRGGGSIIFTGATSSVRGAALAFSSAKFAVRGLAQALARELWPRNIHVAHVVIDGIIDTPAVRERFSPRPGEPLLNPDAIAYTYWALVQQDKSAWSLEVDVRPCTEKFFE
jgi:NAD(P)-dependent dehydrogenase (short-subunit alcohol dehydrogenase family)